ncbi:uncharacterized protein LOC110987795 isoform X2 [Acanthaster planci]|uniref:Uncharacterized protein LOC110987795 isoform X2 n=1 Tax=Acanthaster planci TaxID=133434 RepID=A0A8B7ZM94_ACAPL|nr:uncharacterized protein LOC110987795 isoform X2 [Acanthaster planci]
MAFQKRPRVSPYQAANKWCALSEDQEGFEKRFVSAHIGHGIFTTKPFGKGQFLLEYRGSLAPSKEEDDNTFQFHFKHNNVTYSIDAFDSTCLARWINDDWKTPNCIMKKMVFHDRTPHLCLFSLCDIDVDEELRYDYGVADLPWRNESVQPTSSIHQTANDSSSENQRIHDSGDDSLGAQFSKMRTVSDSASENPLTSDDEDNSDTSYKPSEDEESSGFVPESSDEELSCPASPILIPRGNYPPPAQGDHELEDAGHSSTYKLRADTMSEPTSSSHQAYKTTSSADNSHIQVLTTSNQDGRVYDKPQYCPFCCLPQKKLPRHLKTPQHKDEAAVQEWQETVGKKQKEIQLTLLRNYGNFLHNSSVLQEGKGTLIVVYRPTHEVNPYDYLPCQECYGYYAKSDLWKHRCCKKSSEESDTSQSDTSRKKKRYGLVKASRMMLPVAPGVSKRTHEIMSKMKSDSIARVARSDPLIRKFAEKLTMKHGHCRDQEGYIRQRIRELSRLILEYRVLTGEKNAELTDLIYPPKFESVTHATRIAAGFNEDTNLYTTPSLALKIGHSLKICTDILKGEALISGDEFTQKRCKGFLSLYDLNWEEKVSHHALRSLNETKRNNPKLLPLTQDVVKLSKYLKEQVKASQEELERANGPEISKAWRKLAEALLAQVVVFNRKRPGEVSKMSLEDYCKCSSGEVCILDGALSEFEKALCRVLWRVEIIGKRSRTVAVLLTADMKKAMDTLTAKRSSAHISEDNVYLFALSGEGHIRACDCLRESSVQCGAEHPEYLRATRLRKQIATVSQIMNLKENELDVLANFLGHDIRTHRQYYRLPNSTLQVAKVSKVLMKMERGDMKGLAGKSLADVDIHPSEEYITDAESDESDSEAEDKVPDVLPPKPKDGKGKTKFFY